MTLRLFSESALAPLVRLSNPGRPRCDWFRSCVKSCCESASSPDLSTSAERVRALVSVADVVPANATLSLPGSASWFKVGDDSEFDKRDIRRCCGVSESSASLSRDGDDSELENRRCDLGESICCRFFSCKSPPTLVTDRSELDSRRRGLALLCLRLNWYVGGGDCRGPDGDAWGG